MMAQTIPQQTLFDSSQSSDESFGCFGRLKHIKQLTQKAKTQKTRRPSAPIVLTIQSKIKSLKPSLIAKLKQAAMEVNTTWNYCNEVSHKAISDRNKWLTPFDLNTLMTGNMKFSDDNPFGFKVINNAVTQCVASEYITRRNQFKKSKLRWRQSTGSLSNGRTTSWIPFKEEHVSITYAYSFIQTTTTQKIKTNRKTGVQTTTEVVKEKVFERTIRVAGKNTPHDNMYALYSLNNDSETEYGLPTRLGIPTIKVLGTHLKIFNHEYLSYYLYHLGAVVVSGSITENTIGEWFLNLAVAVDFKTYQEKHCFGKLKIPKIAQRDVIGLDPGCNTMVVSSDGTEYYSNGQTIKNLHTNPENSLSDNPPKSPHLALENKIKHAQQENDWDQVRRLFLKAKNQLNDSTSKAALDITRKAQWIRMGDLKITALVKRKTVQLSEKDYKKHRSQVKRQKGIQKEFEKQNTSNTSNGIAHSTKKEKKGNTKNVRKNNNNHKKGKRLTKKRKGLGKSLLSQGIGSLKLRLGSYSHRTGRGYVEVNERNTSQVCCNCGRKTGPRGLKQLGVRKWICGTDHQVGLFNPAKVKWSREGCGTTHLRDLCAAHNVEHDDFLSWVYSIEKNS